MFPRSSEVQTSESWLQLSLQFVSNMKKTNRQTKRFVPPQHNMTQRQVVPTSHLLLQCETEPHFYVHAPARRWNICKSHRLKPNDVSGRIPSQSNRNLVSSKSEWWSWLRYKHVCTMCSFRYYYLKKNKINTRITYGLYMLVLLVIREEMEQLQGCPVNLPCQGYP